MIVAELLARLKADISGFTPQMAAARAEVAGLRASVGPQLAQELRAGEQAMAGMGQTASGLLVPGAMAARKEAEALGEVAAKETATGIAKAESAAVGFASTARGPVTQSAAQAERSLASLGRSGQGVAGVFTTLSGLSPTQGLVAGLGLAAVAGARMGISLDKTFAQVQALAGDTGMSIADMRHQVEQLAISTAQDPRELGQALYFVASAGLKASQVMPVLRMSAEGAAAGMGDAATIAQTLTSVMNAYAGTGLTAANAMNIMTEAVKVGKAETTDFATGLGPVISVAANAGVSFNDLAAALAEATNQGLPFDRAVTGIRFLISSLESPTGKAENAMNAFGFTASGVADALKKPGGLEHELQLMYDRFSTAGDAGRQAWAAVTGGARGAVVAVDLVGRHTADTNAIVAQLGQSAQDSSTAFRDALSRMTGTDAFQLAQTLTKLKVAAINFGEGVIMAVRPVVPLLSFAADSAGTLLTVFLAYKAITFVPILLANIAQGLQLLGATSIASRLTGTAMGLQLLGSSSNLVALAVAGLAIELDTLFTKGPEGFVTGTATGVRNMTNIVKDFEHQTARAANTGLTLRDRMAQLHPAMDRLANGDLPRAADAMNAVGTAASTTGKQLQVFAGMTGKKLAEWKTQVEGSFNGVKAGLDDLASKTHLTVQSIINEFQRQATALADYGKNLQELESRNIPSKLLAQLVEMGPSGALVIDKLANASQADFKAMVASMLLAGNKARWVQGIINDFRDKTFTVTARFVTIGGIATAPHQQHHSGGWVPGIGPRLAMLMGGEFVMNPQSARAVPAGILEALNRWKEFAPLAMGAPASVTPPPPLVASGASHPGYGRGHLTGSFRITNWREGSVEMASDMEWQDRHLGW